MRRENLFDDASPIVRKNIIRDVKEMSRFECGVRLTDDAAEDVARAILQGARERDALYRVSTKRLCRLVAEVRR